VRGCRCLEIAAAPPSLDARLSGSQRNAIVSCIARPGLLRSRLLCCGTTRATFSPNSELFADWRSCWCSAPTFADSLAVCYRVSPGETALPFHRKRPAYEAPTKRMLKYCGVELDPKSRTLLDDHPVEVVRQMAVAARADFGLVRPSELMSRAWMKDAADARVRDCPNIKRIIKPVQPHQPLGGVGDSARHRRRADAPQHAQALHRAGALLPRRAEPARHVRRRPQPVGRAAGSRGLWEKLSTKWEKRYARARPALQSQVELGPRCARCCAASTKWAWLAFDDARLLNLNKKRREADVLRCVRRCQHSEYVCAPQRRDRPLTLAHARAV
jgi:hypothetical protein